MCKEQEKKCFEEKLTENIEKPNKNWQALKLLRLPYNETAPSNT